MTKIIDIPQWEDVVTYYMLALLIKGRKATLRKEAVFNRAENTFHYWLDQYENTPPIEHEELRLMVVLAAMKGQVRFYVVEPKSKVAESSAFWGAVFELPNMYSSLEGFKSAALEHEFLEVDEIPGQLIVDFSKLLRLATDV
ncbi:hypothetical protein A2771_02950 [Candidatus Woesebacteria bacterium RIFCSPHIGHO2_01_FULL_38_26b]|uniref:Uncharacterized protein n=1 Tax=Candidatus Woesebacteria bacterium RIFCSPHIGHO2_01_FULL_38_26b TaxID=1802491 RepID=A0A1F7XWL5_9BACT|nr:MAG: hypothetical protein A2771_02950 [Candidatus Woesebacteria bacterium RIFCSPHIGHO2_01_FULL_38_26b]